MAEIFPFRAYRYNLERVKLADVVTQPYDKITPAMQEHYAAASPYNLIAVEKGKPSPTDSPADNVYTRAEEALRGMDSRRRDGARHAARNLCLFPGVCGRRERRNGAHERVSSLSAAWRTMPRGSFFGTSRRSPGPRPTGSNSCATPTLIPASSSCFTPIRSAASTPCSMRLRAVHDRPRLRTNMAWCTALWPVFDPQALLRLRGHVLSETGDCRRTSSIRDVARLPR